jgi:hypothetical protein
MKLLELVRVRAALRRLQARAHKHLADELAALHDAARKERARREAVECERAMMAATPFSGPMRQISLHEALRSARQRSSQPRWREEVDFYERNSTTMLNPDGGGV